MARDIEEFLRKAAQRRAQAQQAANQARGGPPPAARAQPAQRPPGPQPGGAQSPQPDIVVGEVVEPAVVETRSTKQLERKVSKLESNVSHADEKMAAHVHEKFEHRLGSLKMQGQSNKTTGVVHDSDRNTAADELIKMLKNPSSLRAAIIMSEVLERPEHRW